MQETEFRADALRVSSPRTRTWDLQWGTKQAHSGRNSEGFQGSFSLLAAHKTQDDCQFTFHLDLSGAAAATGRIGCRRQKIDVGASRGTGEVRPMLDVSAGRGKFTPCIRLVIADPQPVVLQGLKSVFANQNDFEIVASCGCGTSFLEAIRNFAPDVALVAGTLPNLTVSEILAIAKAENLCTRLMFFAESKGDDDLTAAIAAGACNAISTYADPGTILRALRLATEGISASLRPSADLSPNENDADSAKIEKMLRALTLRERQIVQLVSEGLSNKEIARELNVSRGTVKVHLYNIFQKLEVSNRTVLATIALQRSTGFTTLALALASAILSDVDPSDASDALPDDAAPTDIEHRGLGLWKKPILPLAFAADPDSAIALTQKASFAKASHVTHPAARMEGPFEAGQAALSNSGRGHGPIGSSAPSAFISPLLQALNNSQSGTPTAQQPFTLPEFASNPIRNHGGYAIFAVAAAGLGISALDSSHAVQALERDETLVGATATSRDGAFKLAAIDVHVASKGDLAAVDNLASAPVVQDPHSAHAVGTIRDGVAEGNAGRILHGKAADDLKDNGLVSVVYGGSGNDTIGKAGDDTVSGGSGGGNKSNDADIGGHGGEGHGADRAPDGHGRDGFANPSADSKSSRSNSGIDFTSGADWINLAAFGALALLQLTPGSQSVPPHTLAWIYDPVSNETIVYVNTTDHSLDIGDAGLLEIHLQGVVSAAEFDSVFKSDAAAIAVALQGIDPALLAAVSDGTVLTTDGLDASLETGARENTSGAAGGWTMPADDGLRLHFGLERISSNVSTRLVSFDNSDDGAEERDVGSSNIPVHISSIELANSHATALAEENSAFKKSSTYANVGADTIGHGNPHANAGLLFDFNMQSAGIVTPVAVEEISEHGNATRNGQGHDSSQYALQSHGAKGSEAANLADDGQSNNGVAHGKSEHASKSAAGEEPPTAALNGSGDVSGHDNSQHPTHPASAKSSDVGPTEPADKPGHGNSDHASKSAAVETPGMDGSGNAPGHGNSQHPTHLGSAKTSSNVEVTDSASAPGHGNSEPPSNSASGKALTADKSAQQDVTPGSTSHGNSHASPPASASAVESAAPVEPGAAPDNGVNHGNSKGAVTTAAEQTSGPESAFHFKDQSPFSGAAAVVDLTELQNPPVHGAELTAILETDHPPFEVHGNSHVQNGQHHALAHSPHDLLP